MANGGGPPILPGDSVRPDQPPRTFLQAALGLNETLTNNQSHDFDSPDLLDADSLNPVSTYLGKPAVLFTKLEQSALVASLKYVLIGKFSHGRPSIVDLRRFFDGLKLVGKYNLSIFDNKHLFIELEMKIDYVRIWLQLVWIINGFAMRVFKWKSDFTPLKESPLAPVWIRLEGLPLYLFDVKSLCSIANAIGKPLRVDKLNVDRVKLNSARVCVELNVNSPLHDSVWVGFKDGNSSMDGIWVSVFYDFMPQYCSSCEHIGHNLALCKRQRQKEEEKQDDVNLNKGKEVMEAASSSTALPGMTQGLVLPNRVVGGHSSKATTSKVWRVASKNSNAPKVVAPKPSLKVQNRFEGLTIELPKGDAVTVMKNAMDVTDQPRIQNMSLSMVVRDEPVVDRVDGAAAEQETNDASMGGAIVIWEAADSVAQPAVVCAPLHSDTATDYQAILLVDEGAVVQAASHVIVQTKQAASPVVAHSDANTGDAGDADLHLSEVELQQRVEMEAEAKEVEARREEFVADDMSIEQAVEPLIETPVFNAPPKAVCSVMAAISQDITEFEEHKTHAWQVVGKKENKTQGVVTRAQAKATNKTWADKVEEEQIVAQSTTNARKKQEGKDIHTAATVRYIDLDKIDVFDDIIAPRKPTSVPSSPRFSRREPDLDHDVDEYLEDWGDDDMEMETTFNFHKRYNFRARKSSGKGSKYRS